MKKIALTLTLAMSAASVASAQIYAYEGFDYTLGSSLGAAGSGNGGFGWGGDWAVETAGTSDFTVVANGTGAFPVNLNVNGLRIQKSGGGAGTGTEYSRALDSALSFSDGDELWFSFTIQGSFNSGFQNGLEFWDGGNQVLVVGNDPTKTSPDRNQIAAVDDNNARIQSTLGISASSNFLQVVVGKIDFASGDESLSLYYGGFVPGGEGGLGTNMAAAFENQAIGNIGSISSIRVDINNSAQGFVDEIRLGGSYSDVISAVPEPSAYALIAGSLALGWMMVRRRK